MSRLATAMLSICALLFLVVLSAASSGTAYGIPVTQVDMKLLVICADGSEPSCDAAVDILDRLGTPYDKLLAANEQLTSEMLIEAPGDGHYSGIILATGSLSYYDGASWQSALTVEEWELLRGYEAGYGVREASLYTYPTGDFGLSFIRTVDTSSEPIAANLTQAGSELFSYMNPSATVIFENSWGYLAEPVVQPGIKGTEVTPLLVTADGYTVAAMSHHPEGRMSLAICVDHNPNLIHTQLLLYGVVNWVSEGTFLGERHAYLLPQIDDFLIGDEQWDTATNTTDPAEHRMTAGDLEAIKLWQQNLNSSHPTAAGVRIDMVFNGEGTTAYGADDPLTAKAIELESFFLWTNHTYSHRNLDNTNYTTSLEEIQQNNDIAASMGLTQYSPASLVTGDMSGLTNPHMLEAARDAGVRYISSNASIPWQNNPSHNTGVVSEIEPSILFVPRHPNNIFYNCVSPEQEVSEYNYLYSSYWGRDLTYEEILDIESDQLLSYLLKYDIDPLMFHQSNLGIYDSPVYGQGALLTDLIDTTVSKYEALVTIPILSLSFEEVGLKMEGRAECDQSGLAGGIGGGNVILASVGPCTAPVTGLTSANQEIYGGQPISYVDLAGGTTVSTVSTAPPVLSNPYPAPGTQINNSRPNISIDYTDPAWGIPAENVTVLLDGNDVTQEALINGSFLSYVPSQIIAPGVHTASVTVTSNSGQTETTDWQFSVTAPGPRLLLNEIFWGSPSDYAMRHLSVAYELHNQGDGTMYGIALEGGFNTNGVILISPVPMDLGELAPAQSVPFTLKYLVPMGIYNFRATTFLTGQDDGGNIFGNPSPL